MTKHRVIVLGGGCAGIAAAWALSRTRELRDRYAVDVIQAGFRLGGKGATGRDPARGDAVLEHGLHLWLGFYRQAFSMVHDLYAAWDAPRAGPQRSLEHAFSPLHDVALVGGPDDAPETWHLRFPTLPGRPWDPRPSAVRRVFSLAAAWARTLPTALVNAGDDRWTLRRVRVLSGLALAVVRGLARERARHGDAAWDAMNDEELRAWLRRHGATAEEADAPPVRALYDLGFAFPDGVPGPHRGAMAAGAGVRCLLQIFADYRGAPFWRMNAGMGDTVFAPAFEVLRARGVRFRFFRRVDALRVTGTSIGRIELGVQAKLAAPYEPLIDVGPIRAWPNAPRFEQLERCVDGDLEADDGERLAVETFVAGRDYDSIVLAIPSTVHRRIAPELIAASPRYARMVEHTHAVPTVAGQWWLSRTVDELARPRRSSVLTGLPGLFRTWADMSEIADAERWPERPSSVAYFCNVAPREYHELRDRAVASALVARDVRAWANGPARRMWPRFDEGALLGGWATQYARANVAGWERYVLSLPGTVRHRLWPGDSGFDGLFLAGDWTRSVIDGGSVEGAVASGVDAARALVAYSRARMIGANIDAASSPVET